MVKRKRAKRCQFEIRESGRKCGRKTNMHRYICDEHAEEQESKPYGRYCDECACDTFNEEHKENCGNG